MDVLRPAPQVPDGGPHLPGDVEGSRLRTVTHQQAHHEDLGARLGWGGCVGDRGAAACINAAARRRCDLHRRGL